MPLRRQLFLALLGCLLAAGSAGAQAGTVTGRVTDGATQEGLSGATVSIGERRSLTGPDGRFTLGGVPAGTHTVRATRLGYGEATATVTLGADQIATVELVMRSQALAIEGLVAIGYGERRVRDVTGAVETVGEEEFNTGRVVSPEQLIQGKVAGVQVVDNAEPGGGMNIRIRGGTSVNASNEPLFVIDGVPLQPGGGLSAGRNPLNFINPDDIVRITVLKDASSTAIYGSRGANGVVIIETKTGARAPAIEYSSSVSTSQVAGGVDFLSAGEFRAVVQQHQPGRVQFLGGADTDWRDAIERDGFGQEHSLAIAGAGQAMNYRLSLNWLDQSGVIEGSTVERLSAAANYNQQLFSNRLSLRASVRGARTDDEFLPGAVLGSATVFDPTQPIRTPSGSFFENTQFPLGPNNPLAELALVVDEGTTYRSVGSLEGRYQMPFLEGLSATARLGYDVAKSERRSFLPSVLQSQVESPTPGFLSRSNPSETTGLIDIFGNYTTRIASLSSDIDATAGYSYESTRGDYPYFEARGLESDLLGPNGVPNAEEYLPRLFVRETKLASFFGRVNYTLLDRYLLTLSVRRDGSSRFGLDNQWGTFPAVALAWRVMEEPWFPEVGFLNDLKIRGSWGVNGNQAIGDYLWAPAYELGDPFAQVQFGNEFVPTIRPTAVDPNIKWEETTSWNVGADFAVLDNRVSGSLEYYSKDTEDLLFRIPVAGGTNVRNFVTTNVGRVKNRGFEASLNARILDGERLTWDASINASTNKNELIEINPFVAGGAERIRVGGIAGGVGSTIQVLQPGAPINSFYVFQHIMEDGKPVYRDRDNNGTINAKDLYVDVNGDGNVNDDDLRPFHSPAPQWILGHTSNLRYDRFDLGLTMRAYLGNYVYNNTASSNGFFNLLNAAGGLTNLHSSVLEYGFVDPQFLSDVYVEDASFLRLDNITLGYTVQGFRGLDELRLFGTVQNVFTITGYSGIDPTAGLNGIDNNIYPRARTFSAGVNIGF